MTDLLTALWPLFALILLGLALYRSGFPGEAFWPAAERLNYFLLFPALLFGSLATAPLGDPALWRLAAAVLIALGTAWCVLLVLRRLAGWPPARFGPIAQGILRFNTYLGLAAVTSFLGSRGLAQAAVLLAVMVPAVNLLSVYALTAERGMRPLELFKTIARNPLILACLAGIVVSLAGAGLPFGSGDLLKLLAAASLPLGLLCVGAALRPASLRQETAMLGAASLARLLAMPLLAAGVAWAMALPADEAALLVLFFALPTAPTAYVLTRQFGGDAELMAGLITLQTLLSAATLPLVLALSG